MKKLRARKKRHITGQLSIFAILIFQVLFILFAMSLNIALVVHDKINLQNSVDIAAYYGAMKQAEMMNAIAHINYQIRQSWKLLSWRYRVLGSVGLTDSIRTATNSDTEHPLPAYHNPAVPGPYFFCIGHKFWGTFINPTDSMPVSGPGSGGRADNICERMGTHIPAPTITPPMPGFGGWSSFVGSMSGFGATVGQKLRRKCNFYGYNSWFFGVVAFRHFREDQSARKYMIYELAKVLSNDKDLNNESIYDGVRKTFEKNLSFINKASLAKSGSELKQFNALKNISPEMWLKDQTFFDLGLYANTYGAGGCTKTISFLNNLPPTIASDPGARNRAQRIISEIGFSAPNQAWPACATGSKKCLPSAGMRKKKEFIVFYSVKAELKYEKQIFLPFSTNITLKAKAFAKPFGGRIGPNTEDPATSVDKRLPRSTFPSTVNHLTVDKEHSPNYSRYPGDPWGLRSSVVHYSWAKYIKSNLSENNIHYYIKANHPNENDSLARNSLSGSRPYVTARGWEIAAVAPDLFDVTYFTILPYYTHAYFPKISNLIPDKNYLRGDFGRLKIPTGFSGESVLEQVGYGSLGPDKNIWAKIPAQALNPVPYTSYNFKKPFYKIKDLKLLLTGWNPPKRKYDTGDNDYDAGKESNFGECFKWIHEAGIDPYSPTLRGKIANGCIYGGRTGYSVKMVSESFLKSFVPSLTSVPQGDPEWY